MTLSLKVWRPTTACCDPTLIAVIFSFAGPSLKYSQGINLMGLATTSILALEQSVEYKLQQSMAQILQAYSHARWNKEYSLNLLHLLPKTFVVYSNDRKVLVLSIICSILYCNFSFIYWNSLVFCWKQAILVGTFEIISFSLLVAVIPSLCENQSESAYHVLI